MSTENTQGDPLLVVRDLRAHFHTDEGVVKAVDGVNFSVYPGRVLGVVGESGCGKTITAQSILRILQPPGHIVGGEILYRLQQNGSSGDEHWIDLVDLKANGEVMRSIRGREIGLVFQEPMTSFSLVHTIGNQIIEAIRLHQKMSRRDAHQRAIELLRMVEIPRPERSINVYPFQFSGGLRQRAMIAMALACNPRILIADEPTTALDVTTQAQILDLLRTLQVRHNMAIILITHNLGVIAEMADEVVVMYLGRVVETGTTEQIFSTPRHPYTQALLQSMPDMKSAPRTRLPTVTGSIPHPYNRPSGCSFHPRCPQAIPGVCSVREPQITRLEGNQKVSCFLYE